MWLGLNPPALIIQIGCRNRKSRGHWSTVGRSGTTDPAHASDQSSISFISMSLRDFRKVVNRHPEVPDRHRSRVLTMGQPVAPPVGRLRAIPDWPRSRVVAPPQRRLGLRPRARAGKAPGRSLTHRRKRGEIRQPAYRLRARRFGFRGPESRHGHRPLPRSSAVEKSWVIRCGRRIRDGDRSRAPADRAR
jgi:hypothetical protein